MSQEPPIDELDVPFRDTAAYRIGSQVNQHETRIKLLEHEVSKLALCEREVERHLADHEHDDATRQQKLLMTVVLTVLSVTGGVLYMLFQLLTDGKHT